MPRTRAPFPLVGLLAFAIAAATLAAQFALLATPITLASPDDPVAPGVYERRAAEDRARAVRFELGVAVLGVGSGLGGWAAMTAARRRHADRALAAAAAVCCLASVAAWLALVASSYVGGEGWEADERKPVLIIEYD